MKHTIYMITGVAGSGKTTIGKALANSLSVSFFDGDDFHTRENVEKMSAGKPLTDADRWPWLRAIHDFAQSQLSEGRSAVFCCSALKQTYRDVLSEGFESSEWVWVHLVGDYETILSRMQQRTDHFMPESLLRSQFETYEKPDSGIILNVDQPVQDMVDQIIGARDMGKSHAGLIGLGVMGTSLARNIASKGFTLSIYNREVIDLEESVAQKAKEKFSELSECLAFNQLEEFVASLESPRKIFVMVNAGPAVDAVIADLKPLLQDGDLVIDLGNSHFQDSLRRENQLAGDGILFLGTGVSGGEEGALKGPAIMPGGNEVAFEAVKDILFAIAAKNDRNEACCQYVGAGGSGHFVKMVHNGIEYAEMQLIAELYAYLRFGMGKDVASVADIFEQWQKGINASYLLEISCKILRTYEGDELVLDQILDSAGNKGTGSWTTITACELGVPIPTITAALFARYQSSFHGQRTRFSSLFRLGASISQTSIQALENLLYIGRLVNHHQGFDLIAQASHKYNWKISLVNLSIIWSNGCIIRSELLKGIRQGFESGSPDVLSSPFMHKFLVDQFENANNAMMQINAGNLAYPCLNSAMDYFKCLTTKESNANLIQAQRDYFGAHTYQLKTDPEGKAVHFLWNDE